MSLNKKDFFDQLLTNHLSAQHSQSTAEPCPDENWVGAYLEGSQSEHFKSSFERHLLQCNRCRSELALLLKAGVAEVKPEPAVKAAESNSSANFLTSLLGWVRVATFRPVFAILLVCVVTGVVGYKVLRENHVVMHRSAEMADSVSMSNSPVAVPPEASRAKSPSEQPQHFKVAPGGGRPEARDVGKRAGSALLKTDELERRSRTQGQDREMKDAETFAVEPPSSAPAGTDKDVVGVPKRRDMASEPRSSAAPLQKEALSASERQNVQLQAKAEESAGQPQNRVAPAAPAPAQPARGAIAGIRTEQDKLANVEDAKAASAEKKKQVLAERSQQTSAFSADETGAVKYLESGGKRFELNDGVWRDSSILSSDPPPIALKVNSPEFDRRRKEFAPYQQVLARPEDVLIKIANQVLRIKKAP